MKKIIVNISLLVLIIYLLPVEAQNIPVRNYVCPAIEDLEIYQNGNSYQKDILLFFKMLKETHPAFTLNGVAPFNIDSTTNAGYKWAADCVSLDHFKLYLQSVLSQLGEGHTCVIPDYDTNWNYILTHFVENENSLQLAM